MESLSLSLSYVSVSLKWRIFPSSRAISQKIVVVVVIVSRFMYSFVCI